MSPVACVPTASEEGFPLKLSCVVIALLGITASARAQEPAPRLDLHGFGGWAYGRTNANNYLSGGPQGNYRRGTFALNVSAHLSSKLSIIGQTFWTQDDDVTATEIDYAFAEWRVSDALKLRVGKVKQPFGIYTEVFDVGTVRPFLSLPQSIYGPVGMIAVGYQGLGLRGTRPIGRGWQLAYDVYVGGIQLAEYIAPFQFLRGDTIELGLARESTRDLMGTRLVLSLPVPGLSVGGSAYTGEEGDPGSTFRHSLFGAQAEYLSDHLWLRGEYTHEIEQQEGGSDAFYGEAAYFLTRQWQLAARYEQLTTTRTGVDPSLAPSLFKHDEFALGLNYWIAPEFVLKGSYHAVRGNRIAGPDQDELAATAAAGQLKDRTRLVQLGVQFSF